MIIKALRLIITEAAQQDLQAIHDYIADESADAAAAFVGDLLHKIQELANAGITGFGRDVVAKDLRMFPYRERCFYYRVDDDRLVLLRVLHSKQDVGGEKF